MNNDDNEIREQRLRRALHARAEEVTARDLTHTWGDVAREVARSGEDAEPTDIFGRTRGSRRLRRSPVATLAAVAAAVLVVGGVAVAGLRHVDTPAPPPAGRTVESTPVAGVAPTERPRAEIPWATVGQGWTAATWAATDPAATAATLYLVSPSGVRYAVAQVSRSTTVVDVSPDGRRILTSAQGAGTATAPLPPSISEWDVPTGTSHPVPLASDVAPVSTSVRYTKPAGMALLVEYVEVATQRPVIERRALDGTLQLRYAAIPGLRAPLSVDRVGPLGTPDGLDFVVPTVSGMALIGNAQGTLVRSYPLPQGTVTCSPVSWWSGGILLARCDGAGGTTSDLWTFPVSGAPAERRSHLAGAGSAGSAGSGAETGAAAGWPTPVGVLVLQRPVDGLDCTTAAVSLSAGPDSTPTPFTPALPAALGTATGVVPLAVEGRFAFLTLRGCDRPGASLLAYDLVAHAAYPLLGPGANAGSVMSSVTLDAGR
ncbi:hypothetical protein [Lapillicoccus sp.]|uniref:hypothetical protein n=1 Tax=Lapillicoccus sp. TaxID=1909287 RepID=UPI0025DEF749|nr:hypothetical protein [Lapillicoccus sp.]